MTIPSRMLRERYQPDTAMRSFSTPSSTALPTSATRGLLARVYDMARAEAAAAEARRGLPFSGMFCSKEHLAATAPRPRA